MRPKGRLSRSGYSAHFPDTWLRSMALQAKPSTYDTDLFKPILERTRKLLGHDKATMEKHTASYRVIADQSRAVAFLTADGVIPGNEGRNYILRLILRRAARHGQMLGFNEPFLTQVLPTVIDVMGDQYPELVKRRDAIMKITLQEEERFQKTLKSGSVMLEDLVADLKAKGKMEIPGDASFKLHDTFGFALELRRDYAREFGMTINQTYRYSKLQGRTPAQTLQLAPTPLRWPATKAAPRAPLSKPRQGRYHVVRFIRSDRQLDVFGEKFEMPIEATYEYVVATVEVAHQKLQVRIGDELIHQFDYTLF